MSLGIERRVASDESSWRSECSSNWLPKACFNGFPELKTEGRAIDSEGLSANVLSILTRGWGRSCAQKAMESEAEYAFPVVFSALSACQKMIAQLQMRRTSREDLLQLGKKKAPFGSIVQRYSVCTMRVSSPASGI